MGERLTDRKAVLMALDAALQWEAQMLEALPDGDEHALECRKLISAYRRVQERISGSRLTITELAYNKAMEGTRLVGLKELREMNSTNGEPQPKKRVAS